MPSLSTYEESLRGLLTESLERHGVPGAVVGIARGDERCVVAVGSANRSTGVDVTPDTLFQIGSVTKIYTATLVMQLVHAGLVDLDSPVRGALQEFRVADDAATLTITPRQLLSHTSGIEGDHFLDCGRNPDALWRYVSTLEDVGQLHAPDDQFSYCNTGYGVLGRLVEEATGDHYTRALQRRLLKPLSATRTVTLAEQAIVHRVAAGHVAIDGEHRVQPWTLSRFNLASGGIIASADDVLDIAQVHGRGGKNTEGAQVVSSRAVADMAEAQAEVPGGGDWGLGWSVRRWDDADVLAHDGDTVGQRAFLRLLPEENTAIVVLTNSQLGARVAADVFDDAGPSVLGATLPALPAPIPVADRDDPTGYSGIYERLHQRLAIAGGDDDTLRMTVIPDDLFALAGRREHTLTLEPVGDGRFVTEDPTSGVPAMVAFAAGEDDDETDYVYFGLRGHRRIA